MNQQSLNAPCNCGSGKKYKRCCVNKLTESRETFVYSKYNSKDLLKIMALLQLQPFNHGKNVRIELSILNILANINVIKSQPDYYRLSKDIEIHCKAHPYEDPPEEFFTENIVFQNGNNIVFPGLSSNGVEITQSLLSVIFYLGNENQVLGKELHDGVLFILHIHNAIAKKMNFKIRSFEKADDDKIYIPTVEEIKIKKEYFSFSFENIKSICDELNIPYETINQFVFKWQDEDFKQFNIENNPLITKPFIFFEGEFILVLPTAELTCINEFIIGKTIAYGLLPNLINLFDLEMDNSIYPLLRRMGWEPIEFDFSKHFSSNHLGVIKESLWKFDTDKLAYVTRITQSPEIDGIDYLEKISEKYYAQIEASLKLIAVGYPGYKVMLLNFLVRIRIDSMSGISSKDIPIVSNELHLNSTELQILINTWKFDPLTLWKYSKYYKIAETKIDFGPFNSHLAKFEWYKKNEESFSHPDNAPFNFLIFDFSLEGDARRKGLLIVDRVGIPIFVKNTLGYQLCVRKEKHYPVYISEEVYQGVLRSALLKYSCPIWILSAKKRDAYGDIYVNAILYWLNELHPVLQKYINVLGETPITFIIELNEQLYGLTDIDKIQNAKEVFQYEIKPESRTIRFKIPAEIIHKLSSDNNSGERVIMNFIIDILGNLIYLMTGIKKLDKDEIRGIVDKIIPLGIKKMIVIATGDHDLKIANSDLVRSRLIPMADISYILENQIQWLDYKTSIPRSITNKTEKKNLLNSLVGVHFKKVIEEIKQYDGVPFLLFIMKRHESIIQKRAYRRLNFPVKEACYSKFYNVFEEFSSTENNLNEANLSMRILIEFTYCVLPTGKKKASNDDVDILLAQIIELINYGATSDEIQCEIQNPEIGLLPSGRLGISGRYENNSLAEFKNQMYGEEFNSYNVGFKEFFFDKNKSNRDKEPNNYLKKVNEVFKSEWGVGILDLHAISIFLTSSLLQSGNSVEFIKFSDLRLKIKHNLRYSDEEINAFFEQMTSKKRDNILKVPDGYNSWEVYPWRYNRRISYLMMPLLKVLFNGDDYYLLSARHLYSASENIVSLFMNGTLKPKIGLNKITQLLAERNKLKGKEFRNEVCAWLKDKTRLYVYNDEKKITTKGFFISESDKGDIDILAIDNDNKKIISIECKSTSQSKTPYEFRTEIDFYIGINGKEGLIQKHINRDKWLKENIDQVRSKLKVDPGFQIESIVISNNILPTAFLIKSSIPIYSFYELKEGNIFK